MLNRSDDADQILSKRFKTMAIKCRDQRSRITFRLPIDLYQEFHAIIDEEEKAKSQVLRNLVASWVKEKRGHVDG